VVAVPFLRSLQERSAKAEGLPLSKMPQRLIVMFTAYGCVTNRWFPENSHGELTAEDYETTSLAALAPYAKKLLLPRGIRAMNEWTTDMSLGQGNDPHLQVCGSYFTCAPVTPHMDDPFDLAGEARFTAMPVSPSLDHICARQLSSHGLPLLLRVGSRNESPPTAISYSAAETLYPGIGDLTEAFAQLTGLAGAGPMNGDTYQVLRGKSVLDLVKADLATLERYDMSATDREKLAAWKDLLNETAPLIRSCNSDHVRQLGLTEENLLLAKETGGSGQDVITSKVTDLWDVADLYSNMAVLAALCDASRVIVLKYPGNYTYSGLGLHSDTDNMNHRTGSSSLGGTCVENITNELLIIDRYHAAKFAHLVGQLESFPEGEGTLLDNSATVWFQQYSDGCAMNMNNLPIIQAGGCGGYFKTGQAINVADGTSDLSRGNSEAPCTIEGGGEVPSDFKILGTPPEIASAPINKYFCNLMNAIGVKAGADGFPQENGAAEVIHYGMYDDTKDFASGGANPPKINDPGEFDQLRA
jgi:hypothetical protein